MKLSNSEKETIIIYNEQERNAQIYTHNIGLKRKLKSASDKYPDIYCLKSQTEDGAVTYTMPKRMMNLKFRQPLSENEKADMMKTLGKN